MTDALDQNVDAPRAATSREWEVFLREDAADPLTHAGSVSAPSVAVAREQAVQLFGWAAEALWLCPADEVSRFQSTDLAIGDDAGDADGRGRPVGSNQFGTTPTDEGDGGTEP